MTENEAFLQAIIEDPDDDAPRLVYADWLPAGPVRQRGSVRLIRQQGPGRQRESAAGP
jgi:uncharacterized protein (TIGR02996 family)